MDAITLLTQQHREVEALFEAFEATEDDADKQRLFGQISDQLAVHTTIEERWFYPAVRARQTEQQLEEAYDEHLDVKKMLIETMADLDAPGFSGRVAAIKGAVEHHVEEEEEELFVEVRALMTRDVLEALGQQMEAEALQLMEAGEPRRNLHIETEAPMIQPGA
ncbi:MAG: hemerythrin [bacterium]|nr:hemerythrin [bacterium]